MEHTTAAPDAFAPDTHDLAPHENAGEMASTAPPDDAIAAERPETPEQPAADDVVAPGAAEATSAAQDASSGPATELATPSPAAEVAAIELAAPSRRQRRHTCYLCRPNCTSDRH